MNANKEQIHKLFYGFIVKEGLLFHFIEDNPSFDDFYRVLEYVELKHMIVYGFRTYENALYWLGVEERWIQLLKENNLFNEKGTRTIL